MNISQFFQIPGIRKMNIANAESTFLSKWITIFRFFNKFWIKKVYQYIFENIGDKKSFLKFSLKSWFS